MRNRGHLHAALFEIHAGRAEWRLTHRDLHLANETRMKQGGERPRVHHQLRLLSIHRTVDVKVETVTHVHRDPAVAARVESGYRPGNARVDFQNQDLPLAIKHRLGWK